MRAEALEITHKILGIEMRIYDIIIMMLIGFLLVTMIILKGISLMKRSYSLKGEYQSNGFTNFTELSGFKAYKIGGHKYSSNKKPNANIMKKSTKEDIICSICGISLMMVS
ncbi:hypothetical protein SteCoe_37213 [Stentor coeruleus]|uniref:Uncharacterized protein n=1 Tax=Stentor coeruleus TaxID=5963 RepID=A0A1R2ANF8_9CILI|nr:hypothetical protein SteCoe_37213 [Stentor coeruleus]